MFNFKKASSDIKQQSEEQYKKLLEENGYSSSDNEGFILGEKKDIYDEDVSLEDIINNHLYQ